MKISQDDLHPHIRARMSQRGVTFDELAHVMARGGPARGSRPGTFGRVAVFPFNAIWEGEYYEEKEVTVYYRKTETGHVLLTVIARYGAGFPNE